ncbi:MAG: transporter substrate-binding domain-containing protein [Anaerolineae bacterium]|nr:transporter substrate-binding domain-containing protein [Anaerolineae bacterium]
MKKVKQRLIPKFVLILFIFLLAAQCQPTPTPTGQPLSSPTPTPTPLLIPPIQPGDGSDLIDRLLEEGFVRVGIRVWPGAEFSPPAFRGFSNAVTGGALNGFEVDVAHQIAADLGLELELVEAYPPVLASGQWQGEWDVAIALLTPFDQAPEMVAFSRPYGYMPMGVLIPANENTIQTFNDLANKKVIVLEYSAYQQLLAPAGQTLTVAGQPLLPQIPPNIQPIPVSNLLKAIHQLSEANSQPQAQMDAILGPTPILQEAVKSGLAVKMAPQAQHIGFRPLAIAVVPQDGLKTERLLAEIDKILARLQRQGILSEIYLRWYEQDLSHLPTSSP